MIWAVVDTNVLVSGIGWSGNPAKILDAAVGGEFILIATDELLDELRRVLAYPRLSRVIQDPDIVEMIRYISVPVSPSNELHVITADPADNRVLEAAQAGHADYIVSGNSHLLDLEEFENIPVVTPTAFLELLV